MAQRVPRTASTAMRSLRSLLASASPTSLRRSATLWAPMIFLTTAVHSYFHLADEQTHTTGNYTFTTQT